MHRCLQNWRWHCPRPPFARRFCITQQHRTTEPACRAQLQCCTETLSCRACNYQDDQYASQACQSYSSSWCHPPTAFRLNGPHPRMCWIDSPGPRVQGCTNSLHFLILQARCLPPRVQCTYSQSTIHMHVRRLDPWSNSYPFLKPSILFTPHATLCSWAAQSRIEGPFLRII